MDEQFAKQLWCPFARVQFGHQAESPAVNRTIGTRGEAFLTPSVMCIGRDCMAWRDLPEGGGDCFLIRKSQ